MNKQEKVALAILLTLIMLISTASAFSLISKKSAEKEMQSKTENANSFLEDIRYEQIGRNIGSDMRFFMRGDNKSFISDGFHQNAREIHFNAPTAFSIEMERAITSDEIKREYNLTCKTYPESLKCQSDKLIIYFNLHGTGDPEEGNHSYYLRVIDLGRLG